MRKYTYKIVMSFLVLVAVMSIFSVSSFAITYKQLMLMNGDTPVATLAGSQTYMPYSSSGDAVPLVAIGPVVSQYISRSFSVTSVTEKVYTMTFNSSDNLSASYTFDGVRATLDIKKNGTSIKNYDLTTYYWPMGGWLYPTSPNFYIDYRAFNIILDNLLPNNHYKIECQDGRVQAPYSYNTQATAGLTTINLSWPSVTDAAYYVVYYGTGRTIAYGTSCQIKNLTANTSYAIQIRTAKSIRYDLPATYGGGYTMHMVYSPPTAITVSTLSPPKPTNFYAVKNGSSVTLTWDQMDGATSYNVNGQDVGLVTSYTLPETTSYRVATVIGTVEGEYAEVQTPTDPSSLVSLSLIPEVVDARSIKFSWGYWYTASTGNGFVKSWATHAPIVEWYEINGVRIPGSVSNYTYTGLTPNTAYTFTLRTIYGTFTSSLSPEISMTTLATPLTLIDAPVLSVKSRTTTSITLTWNKISDVFLYNIYKNGRYSNYALDGSNEITMDGLLPNTEYRFQIEAPNVSRLSEDFVCRTSVADMPEVICVSNDTGTSLKLSWEAVPGATGYDIYDGTNTYTVTDTYKTFTGLISGRVYVYKARVRVGDQVGEYRSNINAPHLIMSALSSSSTRTTVTLTWLDVPLATSYDISVGTTVYRVTGTSKTFTNLVPETLYSYKVHANVVAVSGEEYSSPNVSINCVTDSFLNITHLQAIPEATRIVLTWDAQEGADSYEIWSTVTDVYASTRTATYTFTGLSPHTIYSFAVRAVANTGQHSNFASSLSVYTLYPAPSNIKATATSTTITVSWDPVDEATGYVMKIDSNEISVVGTKYTARNFAQGSTHTIKVRASYPLIANQPIKVGGYSDVATITTAPPQRETSPVRPARLYVSGEGISQTEISQDDCYYLADAPDAPPLVNLSKVLEILRLKTVNNRTFSVGSMSHIMFPFNNTTEHVYMCDGSADLYAYEPNYNSVIKFLSGRQKSILIQDSGSAGNTFYVDYRTVQNIFWCYNSFKDKRFRVIYSPYAPSNYTDDFSREYFNVKKSGRVVSSIFEDTVPKAFYYYSKQNSGIPLINKAMLDLYIRDYAPIKLLPDLVIGKIRKDGESSPIFAYYSSASLGGAFLTFRFYANGEVTYWTASTPFNLTELTGTLSIPGVCVAPQVLDRVGESWEFGSLYIDSRIMERILKTLFPSQQYSIEWASRTDRYTPPAPSKILVLMKGSTDVAAMPKEDCYYFTGNGNSGVPLVNLTEALKKCDFYSANVVSTPTFGLVGKMANYVFKNPDQGFGLEMGTTKLYQGGSQNPNEYEFLTDLKGMHTSISDRGIYIDYRAFEKILSLFPSLKNAGYKIECRDVAAMTIGVKKDDIASGIYGKLFNDLTKLYYLPNYGNNGVPLIQARYLLSQYAHVPAEKVSLVWDADVNSSTDSPVYENGTRVHLNTIYFEINGNKYVILENHKNIYKADRFVFGVYMSTWNTVYLSDDSLSSSIYKALPATIAAPSWHNSDMYIDYRMALAILGEFDRMKLSGIDLGYGELDSSFKEIDSYCVTINDKFAVFKNKPLMRSDENLGYQVVPTYDRDIITGMPYVIRRDYNFSWTVNQNLYLPLNEVLLNCGSSGLTEELSNIALTGASTLTNNKISVFNCAYLDGVKQSVRIAICESDGALYRILTSSSGTMSVDKKNLPTPDGNSPLIYRNPKNNVLYASTAFIKKLLKDYFKLESTVTKRNDAGMETTVNNCYGSQIISDAAAYVNFNATFNVETSMIITPSAFATATEVNKQAKSNTINSAKLLKTKVRFLINGQTNLFTTDQTYSSVDSYTYQNGSADLRKAILKNTETSKKSGTESVIASTYEIKSSVYKYDNNILVSLDDALKNFQMAYSAKATDPRYPLATSFGCKDVYLTSVSNNVYKLTFASQTSIDYQPMPNLGDTSALGSLRYAPPGTNQYSATVPRDFFNAQIAPELNDASNAYKPTVNIVLFTNSKTAYIQDPLDPDKLCPFINMGAPLIMDPTTKMLYVPMQFIAEYTGRDFDFDSGSGTVIMKDKAQTYEITKILRATDSAVAANRRNYTTLTTSTLSQPKTKLLIKTTATKKVNVVDNTSWSATKINYSFVGSISKNAVSYDVYTANNSMCTVNSLGSIVNTKPMPASSPTANFLGSKDGSKRLSLTASKTMPPLMFTPVSKWVFYDPKYTLLTTKPTESNCIILEGDFFTQDLINAAMTAGDIADPSKVTVTNAHTKLTIDASTWLIKKISMSITMNIKTNKNIIVPTRQTLDIEYVSWNDENFIIPNNVKTKLGVQ